MNMPRRRIMREKDGRFCTLELELSDRGGFTELSICGEEGEIIPEADAEEMAHESLADFFESDNAERMRICDIAQVWMDSEACADYVQRVDGRFHSLDVVKEQDGSVYVLHSCGQIVDALKEWFPEVVPYLKWHLNGMHAGCEHQDALGWGTGKDIALTVGTATEKQLDALARVAEAKAVKLRKEKRSLFLADLRVDGKARAKFLHDYAGGSTLENDEAFMEIASATASLWLRKSVKAINAAIERRLVDLYPPETFRSAIFKDCLLAPCPECGHRYGTEWTKRELPADVIKWAQTFNDPQ